MPSCLRSGVKAVCLLNEKSIWQMPFCHDIRMILTKMSRSFICVNGLSLHFKTFQNSYSGKWVRWSVSSPAVKVIVFFTGLSLVTCHFHFQYPNWSLQWPCEFKRSKCFFIIQVGKLSFSCSAKVQSRLWFQSWSFDPETLS